MTQRPLHLGDRIDSVLTQHNQLRNHWVIMERHCVAGHDARVDAHARPHRLYGRQHPPDRRQELIGWILGIDATFDGMAALPQIRLPERQRLTCCHSQLELDQVDAGDKLGDGMLHLQTRVHLQEIEVAGRVDQELQGACVRVPHCLHGCDRRSTHPLAQISVQQK